MRVEQADVATAGVPNPLMVGELPSDRVALAARIRELVEATVLADDSIVDLVAAARQIAAVTERLRPGARDSPLLLGLLLGGARLSVNNPIEGPANPLAPP